MISAAFVHSWTAHEACKAELALVWPPLKVSDQEFIISIDFKAYCGSDLKGFEIVLFIKDKMLFKG